MKKVVKLRKRKNDKIQENLELFHYVARYGEIQHKAFILICYYKCGQSISY